MTSSPDTTSAILPPRDRTEISVGAVLPQTDMASGESADVRDFATTVESLGLTHILAYDHVVGGDVTAHPKLRGRYTSESAFHEVFVVFGFIAAITRNVRLQTGVLILPQRQTVLVAKQAAEVDVLSDGRLTLGIGVGWNDLEYEALNEDFGNRGKRSEEQIEVLRALWENETVDFTGRWHRLDHVGLLPRPVQRPIPIWLGTNSPIGLRRAARLADGFFANANVATQTDQLDQMLAILREALAKNHRGAFGLDGRIVVADGTPDDWKRQFTAWQERGVTQISLVTHGYGLPTISDNLAALERAVRAFDDL